jgi:hypothetical protein
MMVARVVLAFRVGAVRGYEKGARSNFGFRRQAGDPSEHSSKRAPHHLYKRLSRLNPRLL